MLHVMTLFYMQVLLCGLLFADEKKNEQWDVTKPFGETKKIEFTTNEGTWMNLDVSPDGQDIVFDMLGDIYMMPVTGGTAQLISGGPAFEVQPRFSPDGSKISFTSDRNGADNIWVMGRDGSEPKQLTDEDFRLLNNACWTPDGNYLVARKHFTSRRSLGAGEMWLFHISGGKGLQLTKRKNDQQDAGEPCVSPDGRYVYFSEDMSSGGMFRYNKDPHGQIYMIRRLDRETGKIRNIITGPGGAVRPQISPDGKTMAFVRRVRSESVLYVQNLATGEQRPLYDGLTKDQQETWAIFGLYPNFDWTPDSKSIIFWAKGKIWNIDVATKVLKNIPFEVNAKHAAHKPPLFEQDVFTDKVEIKMIRHAITSPDGKWLVFNAVGQLWKKRMPDGKPTRLTQSNHFEYWPAFSPDSKWLIYTTWSDENHGAIYKTKLDGKKPTLLSQHKGFYRRPSFSNDGNEIVYERVTGDAIIGLTNGTEPGIYWMSASGGKGTLVSDSGTEPRFSKNGKRIYFLETKNSIDKTYKSVQLTGGDEREHFKLKYVNQIVPSPDENWIVFLELHNAYVAPFPKTGRTITLAEKTKDFPVTQITRDAGINLHWSGDSQKLHWTIGQEYFTRALNESFTFVTGAPDSLPAPDSTGLKIELELKSDIPAGKLALTGARIITMAGDKIIESGTVFIERNRIVGVESGESSVPAGYKTIDVSGKTIMPGMVDVHAHMWQGMTGISPQQSWPYYANLAFGVTTTHDPSSNTEMVFTHSEMVKTGILVGPRIFSTGRILYGADGDFKALVNSLDDARSHLRRMKAVGAFSVKSYNQPRRNQRQQILKAASELEMMVYPEGGSTFFHNMTMILDGHTGVEHAVPITPFYKDVLTLWGESGVGHTPTLVVGYGAVWGENYWYDKTNVWENKRLLNFHPRAILDARSIRRFKLPEKDYGHFSMARDAKALIDAGGKVQLGAHGQRQGLGAHWELWMFVQGGMTSMEALRSATLYGAEYIGMGKEIGSIEKGKLADLLILDKNPLEDIYNSESIIYTMINGRLYDAFTMDEVGNHPKKHDRFYWEKPGASDAFIWQDRLGFELPGCGCGRN